MKIAFFGTPQFAADILSGLLSYPEIEIVLVVCQPDKAVWRKQELIATPVKQVALSHNIEVLQPASLKRDRSFETSLRLLNLDFILVVAYWKIIPKSILEIPKYGCINLHGSILPYYRWASPVQAALRDGLSETGLTTMYMSERMDEWDILQIAKIKVDKVDRSPDIFEKFVDIGPELLRDTLLGVQRWEIVWVPQDHSEATYCGKISKEDGEISFQKQSAEAIYNLYRAYTPWPWIYSYYQGKRFVIEVCFVYQDTSIQLSPTRGKSELQSELQDSTSSLLAGENWERCLVDIGLFQKIWKNRYWIMCEDKKFLIVTQVKLEGKKSMDIASFVNGNKEVLEYRFD